MKYIAYIRYLSNFTLLQRYFAGASFRGPQAAAQSCGTCLSLRCSNTSICPGGTSTVVQIMDYCGSCAENEFLISPQAMKQVTGTGDSKHGNYGDLKVKIEWEIVHCRSSTQGGVILHVLPGANEYYAQISVSNAAQNIREVQINGQPLKRMSLGWSTEASQVGGRWEWTYQGTPLKLNSSDFGSSIVLEVTGEDGRKASTLLKTLESQKLPDRMQI